MMVRSRALTPFPRQQSPTMASSGVGRPRSVESFILPKFHPGTLSVLSSLFRQGQKIRAKEVGS
jgi:hypothetical protein